MNFIRCLFLAMLVGLPAAPVWAQISDINVAINKAGRQRMLSQRMAKAYFQIGQQIDVDRSRKVLDQSVALFDRQLVELKNYAPAGDTRETYLKLEKAWLAYKDLLIGVAPSAEQGRKVLAASEEVLALAQQGTVLFEKQSGTNAGRLVNVSGRQRMLSQRMAKFYQARRPGCRRCAERGQSRQGAQGILRCASGTGECARQRAGHPRTSGNWCASSGSSSKRPGAEERCRQAPQTAVATTSERILEEMESVVALYERLPK